jgi:hypothetical protein
VSVHRGAHRLSLVERVASRLSERHVAFVVIGAAALAVHGISRGTRDLDLFTVARDCLDPRMWDSFESLGVAFRVNRGDLEDPLAGVVRFTASGEGPVDLVVGKSPWQTSIAARAGRARIDDVTLPVARASDLVLLKLYGGGPQDAWDIEQLLDSGDRAALVAEVNAAVAALPADARELWSRIAGHR